MSSFKCQQKQEPAAPTTVRRVIKGLKAVFSSQPALPFAGIREQGAMKDVMLAALKHSDSDDACIWVRGAGTLKSEAVIAERVATPTGWHMVASVGEVKAAYYDWRQRNPGFRDDVFPLHYMLNRGEA